MWLMASKHLRSVALLALLLPASAEAARAYDEQFAAVGSELSGIEDRMQALSLDFTQRRGLIGAAEARERYDDAVYSYLVGEYEDAAITFFALVESQALVNESLDLDSEWYLSECLFEMGNYASALDAYQHIEKKGTSHPFFADAVRRQLEIYGIQQDSENFQELYRRYIISGIVEPSDQIKYTVAKSFYRRGADGYARAKGVFSELQPDSEFYSRARYFMGTILVAQGDYAGAIEDFRRASLAEPNSAATREVQELTWLALGRLSYELGDYTSAVEYYQKIDSASAYFADQLYELAWTYIKQENWAEALQAIEIFLISFPEHRYTMQLKLTQGHLHMKEQGYEKALVSYEALVEDYTPVQEQLAALEAAHDSAARVFAQASDEEAFSESLELPTFAVEMLVGSPEVARAVAVHQELQDQRADLEYAQALIEEVETALAGSVGSIGTFSRGRSGIQRVREQSVNLRAQVVGLELDYLLVSAPETYRPELRELKARYDLLSGTTEDLQGADIAETDRYEAHLTQVRAVQALAFQVQQVNADLQAEATAIRNQLASARLSAEDAQYARTLLEDVERDLKASGGRLDQLQSEGVRAQVMRSVPRQSSSSSDQWALLARDYVELHDLLKTYWGRTQQPETPALRTQVTELWTRLGAVDTLADTTSVRLDQVEGEELALLRRKLGEERGTVSIVTRSLEDLSTDAEALAAQITQQEFSRLKEQFTETIMRSEVGIVDVYWIRKTEVSDEANRLRRERSDRIDELDRRFQIIHQKLEN